MSKFIKLFLLERNLNRYDPIVLNQLSIATINPCSNGFGCQIKLYDTSTIDESYLYYKSNIVICWENINEIFDNEQLKSSKFNLHYIGDSSLTKTVNQKVNDLHPSEKAIHEKFQDKVRPVFKQSVKEYIHDWLELLYEWNDEASIDDYFDKILFDRMDVQKIQATFEFILQHYVVLKLNQKRMIGEVFRLANNMFNGRLSFRGLFDDVELLSERK